MSQLEDIMFHAIIYLAGRPRDVDAKAPLRDLTERLVALLRG